MTALDQANRFLALLDSDSAPHEWHYRAICPKERTDLADAGKAKNVRSLQALEAKNIGGWGAYVVVNAGGHDTRNITRVRALYVDFDQVDDHLDRLRDLVPFEPSKLVDELPGILNMAMTAYAHAVEHGFTLPASCEAARNAWRLEADQVAQFVEEECTVDPLGFSRVEPQKLFNSYRDWARDSGISKTVGMRAFRDRLTVLGYQGTKSNGKRQP